MTLLVPSSCTCFTLCPPLPTPQTPPRSFLPRCVFHTDCGVVLPVSLVLHRHHTHMSPHRVESSVFAVDHLSSSIHGFIFVFLLDDTFEEAFRSW